MNEEVEELVAKIVAYLREDERWNNQIPLTVKSIQGEFSVKEAKVAQEALIQLTEQLALNIDAEGNFRYKPPHPPGSVMAPAPNASDERLRPEPTLTTDLDYRPYRQDLQRILFSSAFRRLAGVTQVFETSMGHMVHNRLTHSVKAGHIARAIASRFEHIEPFDHNWPDVTEAAALAHDLGHPPFGHAGENALDECVRKQELKDGFEGNAQTFRILTKLSRSKAGQAGLNLTRRVLDAVLKYPWPRGEPSDRDHYSKWSVYRSEWEEFEWVRVNNPGSEKKSVDAELMDLADDIAYAVHDIEDAVRARLIRIDELLKEGEERKNFFVWVQAKSAEEGLELIPMEVTSVLNLIKQLCLSPLLKSYENSDEQRGALRRMTTILHRRFILAVERKGEDLHIDKPFLTELRVLKYLMRHFVFGALEKEQQALHKPIIEKLFRHYLGLAQGNPQRLPSPARWALESIDTGTSDKKRKDAETRAAADAVAGLTEEEALSISHLVETGLVP
jgi:dGTPase